MGGLGSGRKFGGRCTDDMRAVDVRRLHRRRSLADGAVRTLRWTGDGVGHFSVDLEVHGDDVEFTYRSRPHGEPWQEVQCTVTLLHTPCPFGGGRPWWQCPRCGRRVALLYIGTRLACRHCWRLAYRSTRETVEGRVFSRANNLRERLGWTPGILSGIGDKPKGMHCGTYLRLCEQYADELDRVNDYTQKRAVRASRRVQRLGLLL